MDALKCALFEKIMRMVAPTLDDSDRKCLLDCYLAADPYAALDTEAAAGLLSLDPREFHARWSARFVDWLCASRAPGELDALARDDFDGNSGMYLAYQDFTLLHATEMRLDREGPSGPGPESGPGPRLRH